MAIYVLSSTYRKPAQCSVRIGNTHWGIPEINASLCKAMIKCQRDGPSYAVLTLQTRCGTTAEQTWRRGIFTPAKAISIQAAFADHSEEVMRGLVVSNAIEYLGRSGDYRLTVRCQDESFPLQGERVRKTWEAGSAVNDRFIAAAIASKYGLVLDPASRAGSRFEVLNQNDTDLNFLRERARANDYELLFNKGSVYFGPMRWTAKPQGIIEVDSAMQAHCRLFSIHSGRQQREAPFLKEARGELDGSRYGHVLQVGRPVYVNGLLRRHAGSYYVDSVFHCFTRGSYRQAFTLLRYDDDKQMDDIVIHTPGTAGLIYEVL